MRDFSKDSVEKMKDINKYIFFIDDILESATEISLFDKSEVLGDSFEFPSLNLNTTYQATDNIKEFEKYLIEQYIENDKKAMKYTRARKDILKYFRKYFIKNNMNLNDFEDVEPRTSEYNNISYHLYEGLSQIYPEFIKNKDKFYVDSIVKSPLVYKVSVQLPEYIKLNKLIVNDYILEKYLKDASVEKDNEVHICIDKINENIVFTLLRFDSNSNVSLGDIVNYGTGYPYQQLRDSEFSIPAFLGLIDNEVPCIVELEGNGTIAITGVKDNPPNVAYALTMNMLLTTHYDDVQFVILNRQDTPIWRMFSRSPHVLGYHSEVETFQDVIEDMYNLSMTRLKVAKKNKIKDFPTLKKELGDHHAQVYLILDSCSGILNYYKTYINDNNTTFINTVDHLNEIAKYSSVTGVSIMAISQRADDNNLPLEIKEHASIKIGMSGSSENDYQELFGRDVQETGVAIGSDSNIVTYNGTMETEYIHTPVVGGVNKAQMLSLIRVVAFEWVRKSLFDNSIIPQPLGCNLPFAYNRDKIAKDSIEKIKDGKILPNW